MSGLVYLQSGGWSGSGVNIVGDVDIVQRQPLAHRGRDNRFESNTQFFRKCNHPFWNQILCLPGAWKFWISYWFSHSHNIEELCREVKLVVKFQMESFYQRVYFPEMSVSTSRTPTSTGLLARGLNISPSVPDSATLNKPWPTPLDSGKSSSGAGSSTFPSSLSSCILPMGSKILFSPNKYYLLLFQEVINKLYESFFWLYSNTLLMTNHIISFFLFLSFIYHHVYFMYIDFFQHNLQNPSCPNNVAELQSRDNIFVFSLDQTFPCGLSKDLHFARNEFCFQ